MFARVFGGDAYGDDCQQKRQQEPRLNARERRAARKRDCVEQDWNRADRDFERIAAVPCSLDGIRMGGPTSGGVGAELAKVA